MAGRMTRKARKTVSRSEGTSARRKASAPGSRPRGASIAIARNVAGTARAVGTGAAGIMHPWPSWLREESPEIEKALRTILQQERGAPASLRGAMRYALFPGGKRLRPALAVLGHRLCRGRDPEIYRLAACLELVHTFTLIHDDLPCMDDDDFRRGRPSCHKAFGEGMAVLAGDALLNLAYEVVASLRCTPRRKGSVLATLAGAVGGRGVLGGQVDDLAAEGKRVRERELRSIHVRKTGSLIAASLRIGGELAGGSETALRALDDYGLELGLLFQIVDDLLNLEGTAEELGRPAGGDARHRKATYPRVVGRSATRRLLTARVNAARRAARGFGRWSPLFDDLVRAVASRAHGGWPEGET